MSFYLLSIPASFAAEALPKPGDVIDKSNYQQYKHLFPVDFLPFIEDGYTLIGVSTDATYLANSAAATLAELKDFTQK